jgi:cytoskeletal protein RodZ
MGAFGENLRRERDLRGVSLVEISQATKIGARMLDAIETERFDRLPGGVFNSAFVRQYARYLGLDEDRVVTEFLTACGTCQEQETQQRDAASAALRQMVTTEMPQDGGHRLPLMIAAGLLLAGALVAGGWRIWQGASGDAFKPPPHSSKPSAVPASSFPEHSAETSPVASSSQTPIGGAAQDVQTNAFPAEKAPASGAPAGVNLELQATDRCTIHVSIDGRPEWLTVMPQAGRRTLKADRTVQLTVDNAAALLVTRNGETLPPLGGRGESKTVTYRADRRE